MKLAYPILVLALGCPSTHQLLSTTDAGQDAPPVDGASFDSARVDASFDGGRADSCDAMDAYSSPVGLDCAGINETRWSWDGRACRAVGFGCSFTACVGEDCDSLYPSLDSCIAAYSECGAGTCEAMDARFRPRSETIECDGGEGATWWTWNGWACEAHADCAGAPEHCTGDDCDAAYATRSACEAARATCIASCDATDARVTCEGIGGQPYWVWDGHDCGLVARCPDDFACEGTECDAVYTSLDECRADFRHCVGPATVDDQGAPTCNVSEEQLVDAAVFLGACGVSDAPTIISGWFELLLGIPIRSTNPGWVTDCTVVQCAVDAVDCAAIESCVRSRDGECPDGPLDSCLGTEICRRDLREGEEYWVPWTDCATLGGSCVMEPTSGDREIAACDVPGNGGGTGYGQTWCDRNELVIDVGGSAVRLACSEYLPGTTCREIRFAGEIPGVACGYPDPVCDEFLSGSVDCAADDAILCVGGRTQRYDCVEAGYSTCESGLGCVF